MSGSRFVYTPQVMVDGRDRRDWRDWRLAPRLPTRSEPKSALAPTLLLRREGDTVTASVGTTRGHARPSGYWAVLEDSHVSKVRAGENSDETLRHDHVVRLYKPVAARGADETQRVTLNVSAGAAEYPRRVVFVVTDAATQHPLQAVALALRGSCRGDIESSMTSRPFPTQACFRDSTSSRRTSGRSLKGSVGLRWVMMSSSRVCTEDSEFGWLKT